MTTQIKIGDTVTVSFHTTKYTLSSEAEVLGIPCSTGDSWRFKDIKTGYIHYVSEGCTVTLIPQLR